MKLNDLIKLSAAKDSADKENIRQKALNQKAEKKAVFRINPKTAAVAASFLVVVVMLAFALKPNGGITGNTSEDTVSRNISGFDASDMIYTTANPKDGEIIIEDKLKAELENEYSNNKDAVYTVLVAIYSADFDEYKNEKITLSESTNDGVIQNIKVNYLKLEEEYFESLGFEVEAVPSENMALIITGKVGTMLNMEIPKGKAFVLFKVNG